MNMKRMVFIAAGILIGLLIIGWMLHSMAQVSEVNRKRREKEAGEAMASQIIVTTASTSIWDTLRQTAEPSETGGESQANSENPEASGTYDENASAPESGVPDAVPSNQTVTEVVQESNVIIIE